MTSSSTTAAVTRIELTPELVQQAVSLVLQHRPGSSEFALEWQRDLEAAFARSQSPQLELELVALASRAFRRLGLVRPIERALSGCPVLSQHLELMYVRRAHRSRDEGAELYTPSATAGDVGRHLRAILTLRAERFVDDGALEHFTRTQLLRLDDLLDPSFGYSLELALDAEADGKKGERDRLRELWRARIFGRAAGAPDGAAPPAMPASFRAAFGHDLEAGEAEELFQAAWSGAISSFPGLVAAASIGGRSRT